MLVKLNTGFNIEIEFAITPFHKRLFAWFIDLVIQMAYLWFLIKILNVFNLSNSERFEWVSILLYLPVLLYHLACEITMNGQSIGKKAIGIKVITLEGGQPSVSQYLIRWAFKSVDLPLWIVGAVGGGGWPGWTLIFIFSGIVCIIITSRSQRIGDLVAGTIIVNSKNTTTWQDTVFIETADDYQPVFPQVMRLTDKDINSVKQIFETTRKSGNYMYANRVKDKIMAILKIETDLDAFDFMEILLKDYNHLSSK